MFQKQEINKIYISTVIVFKIFASKMISFVIEI